MIVRRWLSLCCFGLAVLAPLQASAQLAPTGGHYGGQASDTGFEGAVNSSGGYQASVPMDLPGARGGLPVPVQIVYGERSFGAAGLGWDVPLSYIRRDTTFAHRRPLANPGVAPQGREQVFVMLDGRRIDLVRTATSWVARHDAPDLEVRQVSDTHWVMFDGQGRTYAFDIVSSTLAGLGLWLLTDVSGVGASNVHLTYNIGTPPLPGGGTGISIDLGTVTYNSDATTQTAGSCYKNTVNLAYSSASAQPLSMSVLGGTILARTRTLRSVDVLSKAACGSADELIRQYQFIYQNDVDTARPQLQSVQVVGRAGTPENATPLPVASYSYGAITSGNTITYASVPMLGFTNLGNTATSSSPVPSQFGQGYATEAMFVDLTGDGRPDLLSSSGGSLTIARNNSSATSTSFGTARLLSDRVMTSRPLEAHTMTSPRYQAASNLDLTWRQAIDVNGDGRIDIIDAAEQAGHWVLYLNTPDPSDPSNVLWQRRSVAISGLVQQLRARGMTVDDNHLPLAERRTVRDHATFICWQFFAERGWLRARNQQDCFQDRELLETTVTEWEVRDINGDGYPDVIFNSSPMVTTTTVTPAELPEFGEDGQRLGQTTLISQEFRNGATTHVDAVLDVLGTHLTNGDDQAFSAAITIIPSTTCGFDWWLSTSRNSFEFPNHLCGIDDVNGDGLVDRVSDKAVFFGLGTLSATGLFTANARMTLPAPLAIHKNFEAFGCVAPATASTTFSAGGFAGLRDVTGDGIPDYLVSDVNDGSWTVRIGTGTGFGRTLSISGAFALSTETENCGGTISTTTAGLFDVDGDGRPDVVSNGSVWMLRGATGGLGALDAGRLVRIDNGYGARTDIHYRSVKGDPGSHQVPFPEIVVDSMATTGTKGLGGNLSTTNYAYAGAELMFDPAVEAFGFRGYRRRLVLPAAESQPAGVATLTITDTYAPVSAVDPYDVGAGTVLDAAQRYNLYLRAGRVSDVTTLSGNFGAAALATPSQLLTIDIGTDSRRIAGTHYDWGARFLGIATDPPGPEPCSEMVVPYDYAESLAYAANNASHDACTARGFAFASSVESWRGPGVPSVEVRSEMVEIDDLGRPLSVKHFSDLHRDDDDLCVDTTYAAPTGNDARVLFAPSFRAVSDCAGTPLASETWEYDQLAVNSISAGLVSSHTVDRRSDTGASLGAIREFDARYDSAGNVIAVAATRDDGASVVVSTAYDAFGLVPTAVSTFSPTVTTLTTTFDHDPVTLEMRSVTDPNGTQHGMTFDGFGRAVMSTVMPPGGAVGVLSVASYLGFTGADALGRRLVRKAFTDPVDPGIATTASGRTATTFLDELGRSRRTEVALGNDYQGQILITGYRVYDGLGRVIVAGDPFTVVPGQALDPSYATTYYFHADGTPSCFVRGPGRQPFTNVSVESSEVFPTCFDRTFLNFMEVVSVQGSDALLPGSPQQDSTHVDYLTAIGRMVRRSTPGDADITFDYDRLGHQKNMTRGQTSFWHFDSLGQLLEVDEPGVAPQYSTYDSWGELVAVLRTGSGAGGAPVQRRVVRRYDAFGRLVHSEEQADGVADQATLNDYMYDRGVAVAPQVAPTHMLGRLAQAMSPTGTETLSYDAFGQINAHVFTDKVGGLYVERETRHADGTLAALDLYLPDTAFADEHVDYLYDSAGRGRSVRYVNDVDTQDLFEASTIDPLGRVRQAQYGQTTFTASYAESGRRLLSQVSASSLQGSRSISFPSYDPVGRERSRIESRDASGITKTSNWTYDEIGRLVEAEMTVGTASSVVQRFTYDDTGNIFQIANLDTATRTIFTYLGTGGDQICQILHVPGDRSTRECNVAYDEAGSMISQKTATGSRQYDYYIDGSARTITDEQGSHAQFRYDALGAVQELDVTSATSLDARRDRRYGDLIAWRDVTLNGATTSVLSRTIPGPDGSIATRRGPGGPWLFAFGEARGARFFTDQNGAFVQDVDYEPYGTPTSTGAQPGSILYSNEQWNGGDALAAFGLSHLGARLYDPAIGRFLSRDPLLDPTNASTANPYAFAGNDPVNSSDPSGMFREVDYGSLGYPDGRGGGGGDGINSYWLDTPFGGSPPIIWTIGTDGSTGATSGSPGVGSPVGSSVGPRGAHTWLYDRQSASRVPPEVAAWQADLEREQPSRKILEAAASATDAVEDALPTAEAAGEMALDMVPIYGSVRAWSRGDSFGFTISATSDVIFVLKFLRVGRYLVSGIRIAGRAEAGAVAGGAKSLAARAREIHNALDPIAQNQRTTAILRTSGGNIVAGGAEDLIPAQRALLGAEEIAAKLRDAHAEITALQHAASTGLSPIEMVVTRTICPPCARAIEAAGGTLTSSTSAVWPR